MSRWGKPRKNVKRIDPRYFLNERMEGPGDTVHSALNDAVTTSNILYSQSPIDFESHVDAALYITFNELKKSAEEPTFFRFLHDVGYSQREMRDEGQIVMDAVKALVTQHPNFRGWSTYSNDLAGQTLGPVPYTAAEPEKPGEEL